MKKTIAIILALSLFLIILASCGFDQPSIEEYEWQLRTAMRVENNQLFVVATNEADDLHPEAKIVDVTLTASKGKLTLIDKTNKKTYVGTYVIENKNPKGTDYRITIDGLDGYAGVAMTTYHDGSEEPTLPISIGEYSLYFYG